jgi:hypothetical protein
MTHDFLDIFRMRPCFGKPRSAGVPKCMEIEDFPIVILDGQEITLLSSPMFPWVMFDRL